MIKAIETIYKGYRFRSRLEARWAVFFDALGVRYEYEPEGFDLGNGMYYLPDFRLKCWGTRGSVCDKPFDLYIEVKGHMTQKDADKIWAFVLNPSNKDAKEEGDLVNSVLVVGDIPDPDYEAQSYELGSYDPMDGIDIYAWNYETLDGDHFAAYPAVTTHGQFYLDGDDSHYTTMDVSIIQEALKKARQARFEHGETPIVPQTSGNFWNVNRILAKQFCIDMADRDFSRMGDLNLCDHAIISEFFIPYLKDHGGYPDHAIGNSIIQAYFRNRRYEVILRYMANGAPPYIVKQQTRINPAMIDKVYNNPAQAKRLIKEEI